MADEIAPGEVSAFDEALAELQAELARLSPVERRAVVERARSRAPAPLPLGEPVVAPWLTNQLAEVGESGTPGAAFPHGMFEPFTGAAGLAAEMTGVPSVVRGVGRIADEDSDALQKARGAGEIVLGSIPGLAVVRPAAPVFNALAGSVPRAVGTTMAAMLPASIASAQESKKAADAAVGQVTPPDYMAQELAVLQQQKAAKQQEFNALNQRHAKSGPETQRQALDPLRTDLATLNTKISEAEGRIRDYMAGETEKVRKELPFRQRYPGAAETIGTAAAGLSTFLPFASTVKNRIGHAVEGALLGRAANKANADFAAGKLPEFAEAQRAIGARVQSLDDATSGTTYKVLGAKSGDVAAGVGLGTLLNFEAASIPEQVDALAFPPGHPTRTQARNELSDPDYYKSRLLPAFLWGLGTTGVGSEVGKLVTPGGRVPEAARNVAARGSQQSIDDLERLARYQRAVEAAKGSASSASAPRLGTPDQPGGASAPTPLAPVHPARNSLADDTASTQRQLPAPEASPSQPRRYTPEELPIRERITGGRIVHRNPAGAEKAGKFASDPRKKPSEE